MLKKLTLHSERRINKATNRNVCRGKFSQRIVITEDYEFDSEFDDTVLGYLRSNYSKKYSKGWKYGNSTIAVFVHEEHVLRTSSSQSITVVFEPTGFNGKSRITIIGSGGGQGLFGIDWGSQSAAENTLAKNI